MAIFFRRQKIYVAAPLSTGVRSDGASFKSATIITYIKNLRLMFDAAIAVQRKGHYPYVPGLDLLLGIVAGDWERDDYQDTSLAYLEVCDAVLVVAHSEGVDKELAKAKKLRKIIYYNVEEIPNRKEISSGEKIREE